MTRTPVWLRLVQFKVSAETSAIITNGARSTHECSAVCFVCPMLVAPS